MRKLSLSLILAAVTALHGAQSAQAWNKPGHMVVAAIAYRDLKRSNQQPVIDKVIAQLKNHPDFTSRFEPKLALVDPQDRELYLFMLAARWADDIRGSSPLNDPKAHFVDLPFVPPGLPGVATAPPSSTDNLLVKANKEVRIIRDGSDAAKEAVALTWLFHLVGDAHQPLHSATMFTHKFALPDGDRGGNKVFIRARAGAHTINLHAFWDDLIIGSDRFLAVRNRSIGLASKSELDRSTYSQLAQTKFEAWVDESYKLATTVAYYDGEIEGGDDKDHGDVLPEGYVDGAQAVAERQIVLAGYRLADLLKALAPSLD